MSKNKRTIINVTCSVMVLVANTIIGFWLSPFIVKNIGVEANGFVTLANNFTSYAQLIVAALNSMAARYITLAYVQKDYKKANLYYNSVFWGNLIIVAVLIMPAVYLIVKLEKFITVSPDILLDVKLLFLFIFFNFFLTTGAPNWSVGTYVTNRLDRDYIPQMATALFRCIGIFVMMTVLLPKVRYIGFMSSLVTIILLAVNGYNTYKLTPELRISLKPGNLICSWKAIKDLVGAGIWNSISNVGNMLLSGLDLLICNLLFGDVAMGIISLSKTLPSYIQSLSASIRNAFAPELMINYAKGDKEAIFRDLNRAMKLTSTVLIIPIAGIISFGEAFFSLWVPSQDAKQLQILSVLAIFGYMFTSGTQILFNVFSTVNKVKQNSIAMIISGLVSALLTFTLGKYTSLGIYAVAGTSTVVNLVRNMVYTLPATAKYLGFNWKRFYPQVLTTVGASILLIAIGLLFNHFLPTDSWFKLIISAFIFGVVALILNMFIMLNKEERKILINLVLRKLRIRK